LRLLLPHNATAKALGGYITGLLWLPVIRSASRVAQAWRQPPRPHYRPIAEPRPFPPFPQGDIIGVMSRRVGVLSNC
jgi:hypothetical protein